MKNKKTGSRPAAETLVPVVQLHIDKAIPLKAGSWTSDKNDPDKINYQIGKPDDSYRMGVITDNGLPWVSSDGEHFVIAVAMFIGEKPIDIVTICKALGLNKQWPKTINAEQLGVWRAE